MEFAEIKKLILIAMLVSLPVLACSQTVATEPIDIEWDGEASSHEIAIQYGTEDIIILGSTTSMEYFIDLQSSGYYGNFVILVRGFEELDGYYDYSDWIRSDNEADVIMVDGIAQTFTYISIKPAVKPAMLRLR